MIGLDTNFIIHFLVKTQPEHARVYRWFLAQKDSLATTSTNIAEVLRLLTHPRVFPNPLTLSKAIGLLQTFIEEYAVSILEESDGWWADMLELVESIPNLKGNEVFDARIALCFKYNGIKEVGTLDSDFLKYSFLQIIKI